uniref:Si:ch211-263p13.7 n=1 Tax=Paramormyrops kingsleyae TaxID=1676925 RepID=A0A3B3RNQ6_9TELE
PFFITCFCCAGNLLLFPFYYLGQLVGAEKQCSAFLGEEGVTLRAMLRTAAPFSVLWSLSCYLYLLALRRISAGDASAILCCSRAFAFLLSWIGLRDTFMGVRIVGTILSVTGIVMMAYADGFHGDSIMGVALAVGSACASALFKVLLRRRVGEEQPGGASVLLSCVGMCGTCLQSWLSGLLCLTGVEDWPATQDAAWGELTLGRPLTYPALIALGILMSVPASTFYLDASPQLSQVRLAAASTIGVGYLLLLFPVNWDESSLRWLGG